MHLALEELLPHNGIDDDHEEDEQRDVQQRHHGFDNGVQDNLQTCTREKGEGLSHMSNSFGCTLCS